MAVELEKFLAEQLLPTLPSRHPDRAFLKGILQATQGYNHIVSGKEAGSTPDLINPLVISTEVLKLPPRLENALRANGLSRLDLIVFAESDLEHCRNIGKRGAAEIRARLGMYFGTRPIDEQQRIDELRQEIKDFSLSGWSPSARLKLAVLRVVTPQDFSMLTAERVEALNAPKFVIEEIKSVRERLQ